MGLRLGRSVMLASAAAVCILAAAGGWLSAAEAKEGDIGETSRSLIGSYLAGRFAKSQHDTGIAADFYRSALSFDPGNEVLLEQAFQVEATEGNWPRAVDLAKQLAAKEPTHRMARMVLGLTDFKTGDYVHADEHFQAAGDGAIGELTGALSRSWVKLAEGKPQAGLDLLELPRQAEWAQFYLRYHRALMADIAGRRAEARASYERLFKQDNRTLRTALAYAHHAAHFGDAKHAKAILKEQMDRSQNEGHPLARALLDQIQAGDKIDLMIKTPAEGLAEVFYGIGEALTGEGGAGIGVLYLQLALYLEPDQTLALAALAAGYEGSKKYAEAIATYDRIPKGSPLQLAIDIRKAFDLNSLDKVDEAKALLEEVARQDASDLKALDALGNILRSRKRYDEAVTYYTRALATIDKPDKRHWGLYYARGTCYERLKKWPLAEVDLKKALELSPDQPMTLNYLGYSWIDQNRNLRQGLALIEKAVALKPDDGYIVDSLGWAHFKLGNFKDAVRYLERAVELKPDDPVLNDHFGDALWRVGREREARFQWDQALTLEPEPEDAQKIREKLQNGLPSKTQSRASAKTKQTVGAGSRKSAAR